jgi:hypothetical protein
MYDDAKAGNPKCDAVFAEGGKQRYRNRIFIEFDGIEPGGTSRGVPPTRTGIDRTTSWGIRDFRFCKPGNLSESERGIKNELTISRSIFSPPHRRSPLHDPKHAARTCEP